MVKFTKKGQYYAEYKAYTLAWNDAEPRLFMLYHGNDFLEAGTREQCLKVFNDHNGEK